MRTCIQPQTPDVTDRAPDLTSDDRRRAARFLLLFVAASAVLGLVFDQIFGELISFRPEQVRDWLDGFGALAPLVFIGAMILAVVISPIPSVPLDIAAGLAFGWFWGTVYTLIGAEIGAIIAFLIARRLGRQRLQRRLPKPTMAHIDDLAERKGFRALLVMRVLPVFNFDWVSYASGLTSIPLGQFALATLIGMTPPVIAIVAVGATLPDNPRLAGIIFAALVVLAIGPLVFAIRPAATRKAPTP